MINFFVIYTNHNNWFFSIPVFTYTMLYTLVLSYEIKILSEVLDFASMYPDYERQFHISKQYLSNGKATPLLCLLVSIIE